MDRGWGVGGGRGVEWEEFLEKKKNKTEALRGYLENSLQQPWPLAPPPPQPLDCERRISSPSTHLKPGWHAPRSAEWVPTPETPSGHPHLKPLVGVQPDQRLAAPARRPKAGDWPHNPTRSLGGRQNAQQRGAAGLVETAVPGKT